MIATVRHSAERVDRLAPTPTGRATDTAAPGEGAGVQAPAWERWLPFASAATVVTIVLLAARTPGWDLARFAAYATLAVVLPGTLLYRALRSRPHTFVEDVAMGGAVGLTLELAAWAVFSALDLRAWVWLWPLAVIGPFAAVPRWRRHWRVRGYTPTPVGWSWSVAGVVALFSCYLSAVFLQRNPILPTGEDTRQYTDLPYQLSLAGEMTHRFPPNLPQVAGELLHYHWFGHVHMAMTAMIGHLDLPVVALRLAVPALCVAAIVLSAVVGWRISGRPYVGAVTAVLFWIIGEVHFAHPVKFPFGTQVAFMVWHGMSLIYSWVLLLALMGVIADLIRRSEGDTPDDTAVAPGLRGAVPAIGRGAYVLTALLALGSSGAKASSLPVLLAALGLTAIVLLMGRRRLPGPVIAAAAIVTLAELFAIAVLFRFHSYGLKIGAFAGHHLAPYWVQPPEPRPEWLQWLVVASVWAAFLINMESRVAGIVPLAWLRRARLQPVEWFLLGGALAGPALYLALDSYDAQYFTRAGFTFGATLSAWGYALVWDRARLSRRAAIGLGMGAAVFAVALVAAQLRFAGPVPPGQEHMPILWWSAILALAGAAGALVWRASRSRWPALRGRGAVVTLTAILVAGAPGLVMDAYVSMQHPNGGPYKTMSLPRSRVEAARWVRDHSRPDDVIATNAHCRDGRGPTCNPKAFWLSAYAERSVLVEGWGFAPRLGLARVEERGLPFWNPALLHFNDEAFTAPTAAHLAELRERYGVRWLVVDRTVTPESDRLADLAVRRFDNGRMAVYELRADSDGSSYDPRVEVPDAPTRYDAELGWLSLPRQRLPHFYAPGKHLTTNAQGFRGTVDVTPDVPVGRRRVICSGDSFTFGVDLGDQSTWCVKLGTLTIDTVNMGQGAYGLDQAYLWYRRNGLPLAHQVHIVAFNTENFRRMARTTFQIADKAYGKPRLALQDGKLIVTNVPVPRRPVAVPWSTVFPQQFPHLPFVDLATFMGAMGRRPPQDDALPDDAVWDIAAQVFADLQMWNDRKGSRFILLYLPRDVDYATADADPWRQRVAVWASKHGVVFLDLVAAIRLLPEAEISPMFIHDSLFGRPYTRRGTGWVADQVRPLLRE